MNLVDLSNLPTKLHRGVQCIDWKNTPGENVRFKYNEHQGIFTIISFDQDSQLVTILYKEIELKLKYYCISYCKLGVLDTIYFSHPMLKYVKNVEDAIRYKPQANIKIDFKCDVCGFEDNRNINTVYKHGFRCKMCSDGISYPEKFTMSVLEQLGIKYVRQFKIKSESSNYFYDFYLPEHNMLIEVDGGFHTRTTKISNKDLVQKRDKIKDNLAAMNSINMVRIPAIESNLGYMKNSIIHTLMNYYDLSSINFDKASEFAFNNLMRDVCLYRSKHPSLYAHEIGEKFNISGATVRKYLIMGNEIGIINYTSSTESIRRYKKIAKPIQVIYNDTPISTYNSINECVRNSIKDFNVQFTSSGISRVLTGHGIYHKNYKFIYYT